MTVTKILINRHVPDQQLRKALKDELKQYFEANPVRRTQGAHFLHLDRQEWFKPRKLAKPLDRLLLALQPNANEVSKVIFTATIRKQFRNRLFELVIEKDLLNKSLTLKEIAIWVVTMYPQMMERKYNGYQILLHKLSNKLRNYRLCLKKQSERSNPSEETGGLQVDCEEWNDQNVSDSDDDFGSSSDENSDSDERESSEDSQSSECSDTSDSEQNSEADESDSSNDQIEQRVSSEDEREQPDEDVESDFSDTLYGIQADHQMSEAEPESDEEEENSEFNDDSDELEDSEFEEEMSCDLNQSDHLESDFSDTLYEIASDSD